MLCKQPVRYVPVLFYYKDKESEAWEDQVDLLKISGNYDSGPRALFSDNWGQIILAHKEQIFPYSGLLSTGC